MPLGPLFSPLFRRDDVTSMGLASNSGSFGLGRSDPQLMVVADTSAIRTRESVEIRHTKSTTGWVEVTISL